MLQEAVAKTNFRRRKDSGCFLGKAPSKLIPSVLFEARILWGKWGLIFRKR
jgi:hypothetical protein